MITSNRDVVETLVAELTEHGTLDAEQIDITIADAVAARQARQEHARAAKIGASVPRAPRCSTPW